MKRFISLFLAFSVIFLISACGAGGGKVDNDAWDELKRLGKIQSENGKDVLTITLSSDFLGEEITQESLDKNRGREYSSATLNEDGSVTYKMDKKQHRAMLDDVRESFEKSLRELVESPDFAFADIEHSDDFTVFDARLSSDELGMSESFMVLSFYLFGETYGILSGHEDQNVTVNFYSRSGELLETVNSKDLN